MKLLLISLTLAVLAAGCFLLFNMNQKHHQKRAWTHDMGNTTNCVGVVTHAPGGPVKNNEVQGMAWLCGQRAYFTLPQNWTGMCAPIFISDHTFKITTDDTSLKRGKRSVDTPDLKPHDPIWGSDVPQEFKLWTTGQKVLHSLFPHRERCAEDRDIELSIWIVPEYIMSSQ
ncbi:unnamed protein product [Oreochromis niloticus]|nr:unnamed protein product [Mustela putorius furo]